MGNVSEYDPEQLHVLVPRGVKVTGNNAILKVCGQGVSAQGGWRAATPPRLAGLSKPAAQKP